MEPRSSLDFFELKSQTAKTVFLSILSIILLVIIIIVVTTLASKLKKKCSASPNPPSNVEVGYINTSTFKVRWTPQNNVSSYTVYVGSSLHFARSAALKTVSTKKSSANIVGLDRNSTYYIYVTASNACGESVDSESVVYFFVVS